MIKDYKYFLIENVKLDVNTVIDILKSLQKSGDNNEKLINKILGYKNSSTDENLLMSVTRNGNDDLLDFILKYDVDINHTDKKNRNVLFYCKRVSTFKKLYNLGADSTTVDLLDVTTLIYLSSRKLFDVELYQNLIDDGVNINSLNSHGVSVLANSVTNAKITKLLIKNNVDLNNDDKKYIHSQLCSLFQYYENKKTFVINMYNLLFSNGMKIDDDFIRELENLFNYSDKEKFYSFLKKLKKHFNDDMIIKLWKNLTSSRGDAEEISKDLFRIFESHALWNLIEKYWKHSNYKTKFADLIEEYPHMVDAGKFNL